MYMQYAKLFPRNILRLRRLIKQLVIMTSRVSHVDKDSLLTHAILLSTGVLFSKRVKSLP